MRVDYKIGIGDIVSYGVTEIDFDALAAVLKPYRQEKRVSWYRPIAVIRPWARWAIPATRCQRIRGEK